MFDYWKRLKKKAKKGMRGYPVMTVAFYGPDNKLATKVAVGLIPGEGKETSEMERFHSEDGKDVRGSADIGKKVVALLSAWSPTTVVMPGSIIGCPHESGVDYPQGFSCPECPFWLEKDRFEEVRDEFGALNSEL